MTFLSRINWITVGATIIVLVVLGRVVSRR